MNIRQAEAIIETSPNHRLLRRIPDPAEWRLSKAQAGRVRAVFIDTETTGLDLDRDEVIELAIVPFDYDRETGEIVEIFAEESFAAFRRPTVPISLASSKIHGISDFDVRETSISDHAVRKVVEPAQLVVAHNAAFDRPMVEKHWPIFSNKHWACSLVDVDWKEEGASSAALESLLYMQRWFYEGHRALSDATAALFLMTLPLPVTRKQAMTSLLISARKPLFAVRAEHAAFEQRALLKQRGYRWDAGGDGRPKGWWMLTSSPDEETRWLSSEVFASPRAIPVISVPPTKRFSSRMWEA